jgi:fermentation-respiration switch protein FrsA (DUF1100 family)
LLFRLAFVVVPVILALGALVATRTYRFERSAIAASHHPVPRPNAPELRGVEDVEIGAPGDVSIRGWFLPSRNGATVVLTHGSGADRAQVAPQAAAMAGHGFGVLLFDWPGHGESSGVPAFGEVEREALRAAFDWVARRHDAGRVGAFGSSLGAWVVALVAPLDPRVEAVAVEGLPTDLVAQTRHEYRRWGPLTQWPALFALRDTGIWRGPHPAETLSRLAPRPLLIIHASDDASVPPSMAEQLFHAAREPKELWIVPGAGHGNAWEVARREYEERLVVFFTRALLRSPT